MRWKIPAGALMALAFLIPAAPVMAQTATPVPNQACQTVERKVYKDIRKLVTIDLDTATDIEVRVLASQILSAANADSLPVLPEAIQERLDGTADDLRAFLKGDVQKAWSTALRVTVVRTLTGAGAHVKDAAQAALDQAAIDAYLVYLNETWYVARELDCASQHPSTPTSHPTPTASATPSATPSATTTVAPTPTSSTGVGGGEGGGLPVTGPGTAIMAVVGGVLLALGGAGYLIGRRRRSRFVA
nr:LPXTG cell wall anchor domain-containing protein [uncultured Actinoplanes sp.]